MTILIALIGACLMAGLLALWRGFQPPAPSNEEPTFLQRRMPGRGVKQRWAHLTRRPPGRAGARRDRTWMLAALGGVLVYLLTGWVAWLIIVPVLIVVLPGLLADPPTPTLDQLAALDRWIHGVAATLPTGQSVSEAIRTSRRTAPELLRPQIDQVVRRLDQRWSLRDALQEMADELASPEADSVLAALSLAAHRGGTGATATLQALSHSVQHTLAALREVEAERAKPRIVVRQVTGITVAVVAVVFLFGSDFFAAYATPVGQIILTLLMAAYIASLALMRRITRPRPRARILTGGAA